jgi:hypothetical protein
MPRLPPRRSYYQHDATKLLTQSLAPCRAFTRPQLPLDIVTLRRGLVENVIRRLDHPGGLKLAQKIARADNSDTLTNDGTALPQIGIFEQQQRLSGRIGLQKIVQWLLRESATVPHRCSAAASEKSHL